MRREKKPAKRYDPEYYGPAVQTGKIVMPEGMSDGMLTDAVKAILHWEDTSGSQPHDIAITLFNLFAQRNRGS